jgi:hypothetical protein
MRREKIRKGRRMKGSSQKGMWFGRGGKGNEGGFNEVLARKGSARSVEGWIGEAGEGGGG